MGLLVICATLALLQVGFVIGDENVPEITDYSALDSRYLSEDFKVGDTIGTIKANDPDGTEVEFYIDGDGGEYFAIGRTDGVVTLKKELEFDTVSDLREIQMTITVRDRDGQEKTVDGKVFIEDANDLKPEFTRYDIFKELNEDTQPGTPVSDISVRDRDTKNDVLSVYCLSESELFADACDKFSLHFVPADISNKNWKGELRLAKPLDYESRISYAILLNAWDGKFNRTNEIHIEVVDINDSPPRWERIRPVIVDEEVKIGTVLTTVTARDGDVTDPRDIYYELIPNVYADGAEFEIDHATGDISNTARLDYDHPDHKRGQTYEVVIRAREVITADPLELGSDAFTTSTSQVGITIQDIDDNAPQFNKDEYRAFIPENIATSGNVPGLQMTITDIDSGIFNSFDLVELDHQDVFAIIPNSGQANAGATLFIKDSDKIDYETGPKTYTIRVEARENKVTPALTGRAVVIIEVEDVNDEDPTFEEETYERTVKETEGSGYLVIDLDAKDGEAGNRGTAGIRYKLYGNQQNHFQIDEVTGAITVAPCAAPGEPGTFPCIDYERKNQYILTVSATDNLGLSERSRTRSVQVIVDIIDENDNIPAPSDRYTAYIYEEQTAPVQPLIIKATDPDTIGTPVTYELSGPSNIIGIWQIAQSTDENGDRIGTITARRPIQFSDAQDLTTGSINFQVVSKDLKYQVSSDVTIYIIDINNNSPRFSVENFEQEIREDKPGDEFVITVTATDGDAPTTGNGIVDFFIRDGALGKFTVKPRAKNGQEYQADIYTTPDATFNYDNNNKYTMTLVARDQGTPESKRGEATLVVNIIDINNKSPRITPTSVSITVAENRAPNSNVHQVIAIDPDKDKVLRYYMYPKSARNPSGISINKADYNYEELFRIEEDTGIVRVNKALNREEASLLINDLEVVDIAANPPQTGTGALFVTITEVNDQDPEFDQPMYNITINEELNINYFVRNLHCTDEDDRIARYTLSQTFPRSPPEFFTLQDNSGSLIVSYRIDYEKLDEIRLVASCYDDGTPQRLGTTDIIVNVVNINDNSPEFKKQLYTASIPETAEGQEMGGTVLVEVSATDIDKGDYGIVRYRLKAEDTDRFIIDEETGVITIKDGTVFDREKAGSDGFQVIAYDSPNFPNVRKETTVPVYLTIEDINDNCPYFDQRFYTGSIPESANTGTDTIDILAFDKDFGENKLIAYSVQAGSFDPPDGQFYFGVGRKSGRVFTQATLTGKSGVYRFNVTATDTYGEKPTVMCSTDVPVEVTVLQSQNYAPAWVRPPNKDFVIYILESQYEGMLVYDCKAEDQDPGLSGIVDYFFVDGNEHVHSTEEFRINMVTGIIRAEIEFDREQVDRYFLTLVAKDQGATRASSQTTLIVVIMDVDDNDPVFETKGGKVVPLMLPEFELKEDVIPVPSQANPGVYLGQCSATDADSDHDNNRIFYEILTADDYVRSRIHVNRQNCRIHLISRVDFEITHQLEFNIVAFNEKNDDKVRRHKRATNPSVLPVVVRLTDVNDNPPAFDQDEYFACASLQSPFESSIIDLDAHDAEQADTLLRYSLSGTPAFTIDQQGIIHNKISFSSSSQRIYSFEAVAADDDLSNGGLTSKTLVNVFVTSDSTQAMLTVDRPSSDVRRVQQEYEHVITDQFPEVTFACADVQNHINDDGSVSSSKADVYMAAIVGDQYDGYTIWSGSKLYDMLKADRSRGPGKYQAMFISDISTVEDDEFNLDEDVVLAILIVSILLIAFAILLFILACYCIWAKKKKKIKKVKSQRHVLAQSTRETKGENFENPVYHNSGYVAYEDEYSTVRKSEAGPVHPVSIPVPENLQPLTTFQPTNLEPAEPESDSETPPEIPDPPEPVIETEVLPAGDPEEVAPPVPRAFEPEFEYEDDRIETVVEDGDNNDNDDDDEDLPLPDPPVTADDIETEIRDDTPPSTPEPPSY